MAHAEHIAIAKRWAFHRMQPNESPAPYTDRACRQMHASGDTLNSWGSHFPLVELVRRRGKVVGLLLNGDTWSGASGWGSTNTTSSHQAAVLQMAQDFEANLGLWFVTIPFTVLASSGIDERTVEFIDRSSETYEDVIEEFDAPPPSSYWSYETRALPGTNGWVNQRTGEWVQAGWSGSTYVHEPPGRPQYRSADYGAYRLEHDRWESEWQKIPRVEVSTGRKHLILNRRSRYELELYEREDGAVGYRYTWTRHWLAESLIRARVPYWGMFRCHTCTGTGIHPHVELVGEAVGPMSERFDARWERWNQGASWERDDWPDPGDRYVGGSRIEERCESCGGSRKTRQQRTRTAYFLSGFDHNEPRPSYFFTELPPDARPRTIAEAYEALKPATVKLAEDLGRTVLRQGDQFFIEMPGLDLRQLKKAGGVHVRRGDGLHHQQYQPDDAKDWQIPRFQRLVNEDCWLHGTTHEATEVVRLGQAHYVRGIIRHVPERRTPDHVRLNLGRQSWWLNVPNRTPVGV